MTRTPGLQRIDTASARVTTAVPSSAATRDSSRPLGRLEVELLAAEPLEGGLMIDLTASPPVLVVRGVDHQPLRTDAPSLPSRIAVRSLDLLIAVPAFLLAFPVILLLLATYGSFCFGTLGFDSSPPNERNPELYQTIIDGSIEGAMATVSFDLDS